MIEICPTCGDSYDTDGGCHRCQRAFQRTGDRLRLRRWFAELARTLWRIRLLAAVRS